MRWVPRLSGWEEANWDTQKRIFSGEAVLITFGMTILLVTTIVLALVLGIAMGFGAIAGILWMFQQKHIEHAPPALAHSTTGD